MTDFGKMIGPLPLGAWLAVVGGGLGIMVYTRSHAAPVAPVAQNDTSTAPGVGVGGSGMLWQNVAPTGAGSSVAPTAIANNDDWSHAAVNYLIASNYDPTLADSAIRKYISGAGGLSVTENMLVKMALAHLGAPPNILPPPLDNGPGHGGPATIIQDHDTGMIIARYPDGTDTILSAAAYQAMGSPTPSGYFHLLENVPQWNRQNTIDFYTGQNAFATSGPPGPNTSGTTDIFGNITPT